jgi:hypothetical protein
VSTISNYLSKTDSLPRIDIAVKIAKALRVPLEWLADDAQDWPPPILESDNLSLYPDHELMEEVARRFRLTAVRLHDELERAKETNWLAVGAELAKHPPGEKLPPQIDRTARLPISVGALAEELHQFDPALVAVGLHNSMPGRNIDPDDLMVDRLLARHHQFIRDVPGYSQVSQLYYLHNQGRDELELEEYRRRVARLVEYFRNPPTPAERAAQEHRRRLAEDAMLGRQVKPAQPAPPSPPSQPRPRSRRHNKH